MTVDELAAWVEANQVQDENGIDLSHLRENRRLNPAERLRKHERALQTVLEIKRVRKPTSQRRSEDS